MSHKFHGRSSGRKKTEKRLKKLKQEHVRAHRQRKGRNALVDLFVKVDIVE